jgi:hypothetical protein
LNDANNNSRSPKAEAMTTATKPLVRLSPESLANELADSIRYLVRWHDGVEFEDCSITVERNVVRLASRCGGVIEFAFGDDLAIAITRTGRSNWLANEAVADREHHLRMHHEGLAA